MKPNEAKVDRYPAGEFRDVPEHCLLAVFLCSFVEHNCSKEKGNQEKPHHQLGLAWSDLADRILEKADQDRDRKPILPVAIQQGDGQQPEDQEQKQDGHCLFEEVGAFGGVEISSE